MEGYAGNTKWKQSRTGREDTGSTDEKDRTGRDNAIVRKQEKAGQNEMEHRGRARKKNNAVRGNAAILLGSLEYNKDKHRNTPGKNKKKTYTRS
jgi:hypothetical protein